MPESYAEGPWRQQEGETVFAPFQQDSKMIVPPEHTWMINFRVDDLDAIVAQLRAAQQTVDVDPERYPNGRFAELRDPEGKGIQLWQPMAPDEAAVPLGSASTRERRERAASDEPQRATPRRCDRRRRASRALADTDPLRGIAQLVTRWAAAFVLDHDGVTRTTALSADRIAQCLGEALPDGDHKVRVTVWALLRPMLSPRLVALNTDAFVADDDAATTVDLAAHRGESRLDDLDLEDDAAAGVAA